MRIFHLGLMVAPPPNDSARKAFLANCDDYIELSTGAKDVNQEAVRIAREFMPDIIFMQIQAPDIIHIETVKAMRETGAWICNWNGDIRDETPRWMIEMSPYIR
jgi:CheY-like chemotaxis protein